MTNKTRYNDPINREAQMVVSKELSKVFKIKVKPNKWYLYSIIVSFKDDPDIEWTYLKFIMDRRIPDKVKTSIVTKLDDKIAGGYCFMSEEEVPRLKVKEKGYVIFT